MSKSLLLSLFLFISCAAEQPEPTLDSGIGEIRRAEPLEIRGIQRDQLEMICNALDSKAQTLKQISPTSYDYTFSFSQRNCNDTELSAPKDVITRIEPSSFSEFSFKTQSGDFFPFTAVETRTSGIMAEICRDVSAPASPVIIGNTGALWYTLSVPSDYCTSDADGLCVYFQHGSLVSGNDYRINAVEVIKFRMINQYKGFFVERRLVSAGNCSGDKKIEKRAVLK